MTSGSSTKPTLEEASTSAQAKVSTTKHEFEGHNKAIWSFVFLHDNVHIVSSSEDGTMRKWNCDTGLVVGEPWKGEGGGIYALALSPNGKTIACGREDGTVQRWTTNGEMIECVWTGNGKKVWSLSWSPNGKQIASGSEDGTILIRKAKSGKIKVGPIETKQDIVRSLAYAPSGKRIASGGGDKTVCIWNKKTGELVVGPIEDQLGFPVTSLVWSSNSKKLYSASDKLARVFQSKSGAVLHRFQHDHALYAIALSPTQNVLACVGTNGIAQLWDTKSHQPLGPPLPENRTNLFCVSFSRDGKYLVYGGDYGKLTLWTVKDIAPQLPALSLRGRRSTQQETRSNSTSSYLDADAKGCDEFIEEAHDDTFFQSSQQYLPSPSPGFHLPSLFSARPLWNAIFPRRPPPDESVPQERSKRDFFSRRVRSNSSLELATTKHSRLVPEGECEGEQGESIDDRGHSAPERIKANSEINLAPMSRARRLMIALPPRASIAKIVEQSWNDYCSFEGEKPIHSSTRLANAPQPILRQLWHWNSSLFPVRSSRRPVDVVAWRDEDKYAIAPGSNAEAAPTILRTNGDVVDNSTRPDQPAMGAPVPRGRLTQIQASTSGLEEIGVSCCGFFFGHRRHSN
ncbi:WD40-repeat-containing domain protein [Suillus subalutaceus]|uniref:WD40-repeat-containing domain protein n=1 Tax=Suillus subalutaceus TaxID=48586 RepID=UPI001B862FFD|nr:WD40-repeat-containing domain protein [Suillus subalutaceus]KAG1849913.1 WD40-repeat-containing domain protein [Suillus subalutaceus]